MQYLYGMGLDTSVAEAEDFLLNNKLHKLCNVLFVLFVVKYFGCHSRAIESSQ